MVPARATSSLSSPFSGLEMYSFLYAVQAAWRLCRSNPALFTPNGVFALGFSETRV